MDIKYINPDQNERLNPVYKHNNIKTNCFMQFGYKQTVHTKTGKSVQYRLIYKSISD
jgi:hypothetical protein